MKATLEFDLPEDYDDFENATKGLDMSIIIDNALSNIRHILKHEDISEKEYDVLERVRDSILEDMNERGVKVL